MNAEAAGNLGELIDQALWDIEDANKAKLEGVLHTVSFNDEKRLGETKDRNARLKHILTDFHDPRLDLRPSRIGNLDVIGNCYEYLIARFASEGGKKGGEFFTPPEVSGLIARLVAPKPGDRICDPTCGSGSLLIKVAKEIHEKDGSPSNNFSLYGQEVNSATYALCRMNMFLHGIDSARIVWGDTINNPKLLENDRLSQFDIVVANPPFSLDICFSAPASPPPSCFSARARPTPTPCSSTPRSTLPKAPTRTNSAPRTSPASSRLTANTRPSRNSPTAPPSMNSVTTITTSTSPATSMPDGFSVSAASSCRGCQNRCRAAIGQAKPTVIWASNTGSGS